MSPAGNVGLALRPDARPKSLVHRPPSISIPRFHGSFSVEPHVPDKNQPPLNVVGIGTDIVECLRIAQMIERHGELFINRVFTPSEIRYCQTRPLATQHYAGRWTAKEAILKSIGADGRKGISWRDVEIRNDSSGRPVVGLRGGARDVVEHLGIRQILVSIGHCRSHATAHAIALGLAADSPEKER